MGGKQTGPESNSDSTYRVIAAHPASPVPVFFPAAHTRRSPPIIL